MTCVPFGFDRVLVQLWLVACKPKDAMVTPETKVTFPSFSWPLTTLGLSQILNLFLVVALETKDAMVASFQKVRNASFFMGLGQILKSFCLVAFELKDGLVASQTKVRFVSFWNMWPTLFLYKILLSMRIERPFYYLVSDRCHSLICHNFGVIGAGRSKQKDTMVAPTIKVRFPSFS